MIDLIRQALTSQFEAALSMVKQCVAACPAQHWEGKVANSPFRWVAYHTLFFADFYLTRDEQSFALRDLHERGGDERGPEATPGLSQEETVVYVAICRQKAVDIVTGETERSLQEPAGFARRKCSRLELHVYNIRHVQHHAGQMSAYLRRVDAALADEKALPWVGHGWK